MASGNLAEITGLLKAWGEGDRGALDRLLPLVERELHRIAGRYMRGERTGQTLQTTALVNELYLRLVDIQGVNWQARAQFFAISAQIMRRILVDVARARRAQKRDPGAERLDLEEVAVLAPELDEEVLALDQALQELAKLAPRPSQVVELRYFGGLDEKEIAGLLKVTTRTVERDWNFAKSWLLRELKAKRI